MEAMAVLVVAEAVVGQVVQQMVEVETLRLQVQHKEKMVLMDNKKLVVVAAEELHVVLQVLLEVQQVMVVMERQHVYHFQVH
jgi:hypothetical protein